MPNKINLTVQNVEINIHTYSYPFQPHIAMTHK